MSGTNPKKCEVGAVEVQYLGIHLGHEQVCPQIEKTSVIAGLLKTKKGVRLAIFIGLYLMF